MNLNVRLGDNGPWMVDVLLLVCWLAAAIVGAFLVEPVWLTAVVVGIAVVGAWVSLYAMVRL